MRKLFLFILLLLCVLIPSVHGLTLLNGCGTLATANEVYQLNISFTSNQSYCFVVSGSNVTLDMNAKTVTLRSTDLFLQNSGTPARAPEIKNGTIYAPSGLSTNNDLIDFPVDSDYLYIHDLLINASNASQTYSADWAVYYSGDYGTFDGITALWNGDNGIIASYGGINIILNNLYKNDTTGHTKGSGIFTQNSNFNLTNSVIVSYGSGIVIWLGAANFKIDNVSFDTYQSSTSVYGIQIQDAVSANPAVINNTRIIAHGAEGRGFLSFAVNIYGLIIENTNITTLSNFALYDMGSKQKYRNVNINCTSLSVNEYCLAFVGGNNYQFHGMISAMGNSGCRAIYLISRPSGLIINNSNIVSSGSIIYSATTGSGLTKIYDSNINYSGNIADINSDDFSMQMINVSLNKTISVNCNGYTDAWVTQEWWQEYGVYDLHSNALTDALVSIVANSTYLDAVTHKSYNPTVAGQTNKLSIAEKVYQCTGNSINNYAYKTVAVDTYGLGTNISGYVQHTANGDDNLTISFTVPIYEMGKSCEADISGTDVNVRCSWDLRIQTSPIVGATGTTYVINSTNGTVCTNATAVEVGNGIYESVCNFTYTADGLYRVDWETSNYPIYPSHVVRVSSSAGGGGLTAAQNSTLYSIFNFSEEDSKMQFYFIAMFLLAMIIGYLSYLIWILDDRHWGLKFLFKFTNYFILFIGGMFLWNGAKEVGINTGQLTIVFSVLSILLTVILIYTGWDFTINIINAWNDKKKEKKYTI